MAQARKAKNNSVDLIVQGLKEALSLIVNLDEEILSITLLSMQISGTATLLSVFFGLSTGVAIALSKFTGKKFIISIVNTSMGFPPVVIGLVVTIFLWRSGPFGSLGLLYTPVAIVIAQTIIASPIVAGITIAAIKQLPEKLRLQALALGATRLQMVWLLVKEARLSLLAAVMAGFGGVISEIGASIMVGGNIKGHTRVLTTATAMETGKGNFDIAMALSIILMLLIFAINSILTGIQLKEKSQ